VDPGRAVELEHAFVDQARPRREVGVLAGAERAGNLADVGRRNRDGEAVVGELVGDLHLDGERVSLHRVEACLHDDAIGLSLGELPGPPVQEPVDRVALLRLGQRDLILDAVEAVAAVGEAVGPGDQGSSVGAVADRPDRVALEHGSVPGQVLAHSATDLDDRRSLLAMSDLVLFAGGWDGHRCPLKLQCPDGMRIAVVGHAEWCHFARVDHVPRAGEIVEAREGWEQPAGGGAVAAVQIARLAGECLFLTALGDDELGHRVKRELETIGVRVEAAWRPVPQRRAFVQLDSDGERTITTIGERLGPHGTDPLPWPELADADAVYLTAGDAGAARAARAAKHLVASVRARQALAGSGVQLDVLVSSASDSGERYRAGEIEPVPLSVVRTEGADGGVLETADGQTSHWPGPPLPGPKADTYGAGDSFAGGLTYALGIGQPIGEAIAVAARCGAACVTGRGPYEAQLSASPAPDETIDR
jgi:ribokinase